MKKRHKLFWDFFRPPVSAFLKLKFGYKYEMAENLPENYIVLSNHLTDFDPLFVGVSFKTHMYLVGSEHIARWGWIYKFLKFGFEPIMRPKGALASGTVMEIIRRVRKGHNVCMFAEGARTWDGETCPIAPATAKLIQSSKCGLVTYKLKGGYFVSPMWSNGLRRGPISGGVVNTYTAEELSKMSADEIYAIIQRDLHEDAYKTQCKNPQKYKSKRPAEGLENLLFICPKCKKHDTLKTKGDKVSCSACSLEFRYNQYGLIEGLKEKTVRELSDKQKKEILKDVKNGAVYTTEGTSISTVKNHEEVLVSQGRLSMSKETITCGDKGISLNEITEFSMHGKNALVFSVGKEYYEVLTPKGSNTIKYVLYYNCVKSLSEAAVK